MPRASKLGHNIEMISFNNEKVKEFSSKADAANYLISIGITNALFHTVRYHIAEVCNGKRQSAYGFKWKHSN